MTRTMGTWLLAAGLAWAGPLALECASHGPAEAGHYTSAFVLHAQQEEPTSPRRQAPVTILQINDVYSTVPVDGLGGLARVATIKKALIAAGRTPLLMMGGDFLSSSVASSVFKGEQMIEGLNAMGLDVTAFGNHEFDFGVDLLLTRMKQSKWQWVNANLVDRQTGRLVGDTPPYIIKEVSGLKLELMAIKDS